MIGVEQKESILTHRIVHIFFARASTTDSISLSGTVLNSSNSVKYLGVRIDNKLTFCPHIDHICRNLAQFNGIMHQEQHCFSKNHLIRFYKVYARPLIEYGLLIYGNTTKTFLKRIVTMQKRRFRTICFRKKCDSIFDIMKKCYPLDTRFVPNKIFQ